MFDFDKISMQLSKHSYKTIRPIKIINFLQQLVTLLTAGLPIIQTLDHMIESADHLQLQRMIFFLRSQIYLGCTFAQALKQYPKYFNGLHCHLIEIGEKTGTLTTALKQIIDEKQKNEAIKKNLKKALSYPTVVLMVSGFVTFGVTTYIIPQFASLYESFSVELPFITRCIIQLSQWLHHFSFMLLAFFVVAILGIKYSARHSPRFLYFLHLSYIHLPVIGKVISKATIVRFTQTLSMSLNAGMPIIDAMQLISKTIHNQVYVEAIKQATIEISHGNSLYVALQKARLFPSLSLQMIKIGEKTGIMAEMLLKIADFYGQEIDDTISHLNHYLEPIITIILGLIVVKS